MCSIWRGLLLLRAFLLLPFRHCAKCTQFRVRTHFNPIAAKMRTTHPKYTRITSNACANRVAAKRKVNWYFVVGDHKCKWRDLPKDSHFYVRLWARRSLSIFFFFYLIFLRVRRACSRHTNCSAQANDGRMKLARTIERFLFFRIVSIVINFRCETVCPRCCLPFWMLRTIHRQ